jgi:hypothetical protein
MRIVGLITVVETPEFLATSRALFDEDQRTLLISYLAAHPMAGDLIAGTGGVRKLRLGHGRARQTRRSARHLLRTQRAAAAVSTHSVREECACGLE